ncbi:hypothetical protein DRQ18_06010 [bacterium]|nr:MAG: hypothetical protein DRQ18_06010 [bacterium]
MVFVFEDERFSSLYPVTLSRPSYEILTGILSLKERLLKRFGDVKEYAPRFGKKETGKGLWINGRIKGWDFECFREGEERIWRNKKGEIVAVWGEVENPLSPPPYPEARVDIELLTYPWEIVKELSKRIVEDMEKLGIPELSIPDELRKRRDIIIEPPVYIEEGVKIEPFTYIRGPVSIRKNSVVRAHSYIRDGVCIGETCKVAGEIEGTVFQGYSNKQHYGFLGHSYVGEWVNLGAGTTNSDLKNNYSPVRMYACGEFRDTGMQFLGCIIGDHTKTAIGTCINTGTVIGFSVNLFTRSFPEKFVPSFVWYGEKKEEYRFEKAFETAKRMMRRRGVDAGEEYRKMMERIFEETGEERRKWLGLQ